MTLQALVLALFLTLNVLLVEMILILRLVYLIKKIRRIES